MAIIYSLNRRNTGKKNSKETIEKRINSRKNYKVSELTKEKISIKNSNKLSPNTTFWLITAPSGNKEIVCSMKRYCEEHNLDVRLLHKVSKGITNHHKNYKCSKVEEPKINVVSTAYQLLYKDLPKDGILIYNPEFQTKRNIILSIVKSRNNFYDKKIYARKCLIILLNKELAEPFLSENHIQGFSNATIHLGLKYENEIVACMSFVKSRFNKNIEWELNRFCSKTHVQVLGGTSKLFHHFINVYKPENIVTYADKRFFIGGLYEILGFKKDSDIPPTYFYVHKTETSKIYRKEHFRHDKMKNKLKYYDSTKSEFENMAFHGYHRIYDLGKIRYIWRPGV